jgi:hypothetical protein
VKYLEENVKDDQVITDVGSSLNVRKGLTPSC